MKTFSQFFAESEVRGSFDADPGSEEYQDALRKARQKRKDLEAAKLKADADAARNDFRSGFMRGRNKEGKDGIFNKDPETGKYTEFVPY